MEKKQKKDWIKNVEIYEEKYISVRSKTMMKKNCFVKEYHEKKIMGQK